MAPKKKLLRRTKKNDKLWKVNSPSHQRKFISELQRKLSEVAKERNISNATSSTLSMQSENITTEASSKPGTADPPVSFSVNSKERFVSNRHKALSLVHNQMVAIEVRFQEEIFRMEERYARELYAPLQALRKFLIERVKPGRRASLCEEVLLTQCKPCFSEGCQQFSELEIHVRCLQSQGNALKREDCGHFWLVAMLHSDAILRKRIQPWDVEVLRYLVDVRVLPLRVNRAKPLEKESAGDDCSETAVGFELVFEFRPNPYFVNSTLTKRYVIDVLPDQTDFVTAPHNDVACTDSSEEWDADGEDSDMDSRKNHSQENFDVDKLLDYTGPQVIGIKGSQIKWKSPKCHQDFRRQSLSDSSRNCSATCFPHQALRESESTIHIHPHKQYADPNVDPHTLKPTKSCSLNAIAGSDSFRSNRSLLLPPSDNPCMRPSSQNFDLSGSCYSPHEISSYLKMTSNLIPSSKNCLQKTVSSSSGYEYVLQSNTNSSNLSTPSCLRLHGNKAPYFISNPLPVSGGELNQKSFFDFFELTWTEKSAINCHNDASRDYQLASYIREVLVPRAYLLFRRDLLKEETNKNSCYSNQVFAPRNVKYEKETESAPLLVRNIDYDQIDDEIPLEISKQALQTIQSCDTVKSEIFRQNKEIAGRMARSAIGEMIRRRNSNHSNSITPVQTPTVDCDVDDEIVRHNMKKSDASEPKKSDSSETEKSIETTKASECSLERLGQSESYVTTSTARSACLSYDGSRDDKTFSNSGTERKLRPSSGNFNPERGAPSFSRPSTSKPAFSMMTRGEDVIVSKVRDPLRHVSESTRRDFQLSSEEIELSNSSPFPSHGEPEDCHGGPEDSVPSPPKSEQAFWSGFSGESERLRAATPSSSESDDTERDAVRLFANNRHSRWRPRHVRKTTKKKKFDYDSEAPPTPQIEDSCKQQ